MAPARPEAFTGDSRNRVTKEHERAKAFTVSILHEVECPFDTLPPLYVFTI
jgi:hypothetical protein